MFWGRMMVIVGIAARAFQAKARVDLLVTMMGVEEFMRGDSDPARHERGEHGMP